MKVKNAHCEKCIHKKICKFRKDLEYIELSTAPNMAGCKFYKREVKRNSMGWPE